MFGLPSLSDIGKDITGGLEYYGGQAMQAAQPALDLAMQYGPIAAGYYFGGPLGAMAAGGLGSMLTGGGKVPQGLGMGAMGLLGGMGLAGMGQQGGGMFSPSSTQQGGNPIAQSQMLGALTNRMDTNQSGNLAGLLSRR